MLSRRASTEPSPQVTKRRNNIGRRRNSAPPVLISTQVDNPSRPTPVPSITPLPHVDLSKVFKSARKQSFFADLTFTAAENAKSIGSFVSIQDGHLQMSNCFREAFDVLAHMTGGRGKMYSAVVEELGRLEQGVPHSKLTNLQLFIDYQVYKVGEHDRTHDEVRWTNAIAAEVMVKAPQVKALREEMVAVSAKKLREAVTNRNKGAIQSITGGDALIADEELQKAHDEVAVGSEPVQKPTPTFDELLKKAEKQAEAPLLAAVESEIGKHYMCRMRYTKPIPSLVARDTPGFIQERLRCKEIADPFFVFKTSNGVTIAYDATRFTTAEQVEQLKAHIKDSGVDIESTSLELTPFDPKEMMIATMQVPVMSEPVSLNLQAGEPVRSLSVTIGKRPEDMGYQMTDEPAGVFRRSLNSQRVTEIQGFDKDRQVSFQMKGAGVPAYGFDMANAGNSEMGTFTGSEFFKLSAEMGSIGLRSFATSVFGVDQIAPQTLGMALVANEKSASSSGQRNGAISFRADYSLGVRLENVLPVETSDPTILAMRAKVGLDSSGKMNDFKRNILATMARNLAITHLFGMEYDDSSMKDLSDVGLGGEFSDSGTLRNHKLDAPLLVEKTTFVDKGVRDMLGQDACQAFPKLYTASMVKLLNDVAGKVKDPAKTQLAGLAERVQTEIGDPDYQLLFLQSLVASLGGPSSEPTPVQQAFYSKGLQGYAQALSDVLQGKLAGLNAFKAGLFLEGHALAFATYKRLGFTSLEQLLAVMTPLLEQLKKEQSDLQDKVDAPMSTDKAALSYKLQGVNDKLRYATEALESVTRALTPNTDPAVQGRKLFEAALGGANRFGTALGELSREDALGALEAYLKVYLPTIDKDNEVQMNSIKKKEDTAKRLIDQLRPAQ